jgi:ribosome maturation factor RimP
LTLLDLERIKALVQKVTSSDGLELVEVEFKGSLNNRILRIYIDKTEGVTHEDCTRVSDQVGVELEIEELIPGSYTLEVSSPGLTRKLTRPEDFRKYCGRLVKVQTRQPIDGMRSFRGTLTDFDGDRLVVQTKNGTKVPIPLSWVSKANLDIDF